MSLKRRSALLFLFSCLVMGTAQGASIQSTRLPLRLQQGLAKATQISLEPPIYVYSKTGGDTIAADVYALLDTPYEQVRANMARVDHWCDFISINLNVKACVYHADPQASGIDVYAGRKFYQTPEEAYLIQYRFQVQHNDGQLLEVLLHAEEGPLGTSHYRIHLQAMPYQDKTLVRLSTGYEQSFLSDMATRAYLNTLGRDKVGFTVVRYGDKGQPVYNDGIPAVIERNAMRYYLALDAYFQSLKLPEAQRAEARMRYWYAQTMQFQTQLYELAEDEYLTAKRQEYVNQARLQAQVHSG